MTTDSPAAPKRPPRHSSAQVTARSSDFVTSTPLPAARPSAFTTYGPSISSSRATADSRSKYSADFAVGTRADAMISFANDFDDSMRAASLLGPNTEIFADLSASATPAARGPSGPTTTRSIERSWHSRTTLCGSFGSTSVTTSPMSASPGLPGHETSWLNKGLCASFHPMACSLPPPPRTSTFIVYASLSSVAMRPGPTDTVRIGTPASSSTRST